MSSGLNLTLGERAVFHSTGHHKQLPSTDGDVAVTKLDGQLALDHEEEFIRVGVAVPGELALDLDDLSLVVIHPGYHLR